MAKAVGIDLGTTNSVIAVFEGGQASVVSNAEGSRTTPSVVAFTDPGERLVGQLARRQAILNPRGTIYSAKRFIGRHFDEISSEAKAVAFDVVPGPDGLVRFDVKGKMYSPEEIGAQILRKLVDDASKFLGEKGTQAVISVPAYFDDARADRRRGSAALRQLPPGAALGNPGDRRRLPGRRGAVDAARAGRPVGALVRPVQGGWPPVWWSSPWPGLQPGNPLTWHPDDTRYRAGAPARK